MTEILFVPEAANDYLALDGSTRLEVKKALAKLQNDPVHYGDPLGKKAGINLYGFMSIRAGRHIRIIYSIESDAALVRVIGKRERFEVHKTAEDRIRELQQMTSEELITLQDLMKQEAEGHR